MERGVCSSRNEWRGNVLPNQVARAARRTPTWAGSFKVKFRLNILSQWKKVWCDWWRHPQMATTLLEYPETRGIPIELIDTLALSGYSDTQIQKMGRWWGATFREQLACHSEGMTTKMKRNFKFVNVHRNAYHDVSSTMYLFRIWIGIGSCNTMPSAEWQHRIWWSKNIAGSTGDTYRCFSHCRGQGFVYCVSDRDGLSRRPLDTGIRRGPSRSLVTGGWCSLPDPWGWPGWSMGRHFVLSWGSLGFGYRVRIWVY